MSNIEQTLSIIKPDAVERNLENEIKNIFIDKGFKIVKEKKIQLAKSEAEEFYKVHETKPFYNDLCEYLSSGPLVAMIIEKENAIKQQQISQQKQAIENTLLTQQLIILIVVLLFTFLFFKCLL